MKAPYFKIESFGAVDGPGVRMVLFTCGCPLRCIYCHNPEAWATKPSKYISAKKLIKKFEKNKSYYSNGGITVSGGEPMIHEEFCLKLAKKCYKRNISLAFDTAGASFNAKTIKFYKKILKYKPLWLVDIKHMNKTMHMKITGKENISELEFIKFLEENKQHYWIRMVFVPGLTNDSYNINKINKLFKTLVYMDKFEILPYHKNGIAKYKNLGIKYELNANEPTEKEMETLKQKLFK